MVQADSSGNSERCSGTFRGEAKERKKIIDWLDWKQISGFVGGKSVELDSEQSKMVAAWNILDGKIDFLQINEVAEYLQIEDVELLIDGLLILKKHNNDNNHTN